MKKGKSFNVLAFDFSTDKLKRYDVLDTFRRVWNGSGYNFDKDEVKDLDSFREWIKRVSRGHFWAKCEWEILIARWPFGSYKFKQNVKEFLANNPQFDLDDYGKHNEFKNIITREMSKVDVHEQIMMNIDNVTDILADEFDIQ